MSIRYFGWLHTPNYPQGDLTQWPVTDAPVQLDDLWGKSLNCKQLQWLHIICLSVAASLHSAPVGLHLPSRPIPSPKNRAGEETRSGLRLWTIKWPQQLWTAPPPPSPPDPLKHAGLLPSPQSQTSHRALRRFRPGYKYEWRCEFMLLLPRCQIWPLRSIPEASGESAKPTLTNSNQPLKFY